MPRRKVVVDVKVVEAMAFVGATNQEIGDILGMSERSVRRQFAEILTKSHSQRRVKLREMQWKAAQNGNTAMLIWLGKQHLGQSEKVEEHATQTIILKEKMLDTSPVIESRINGSTETIGPVADN